MWHNVHDQICALYKVAFKNEVDQTRANNRNNNMHTRTTRQQYEEQMAVEPYNARNWRVLCGMSEITRASKGVGSAIMYACIIPVCKSLHRDLTILVQREGKKTIKPHHAKEVYSTKYDMN